MFSRVKNIGYIAGIVLIGISFVWLIGVVGADDFNTDVMVFNPFIPVVAKAVIGLVGLGIGALLVNGGAR